MDAGCVTLNKTNCFTQIKQTIHESTTIRKMNMGCGNGCGNGCGSCCGGCGRELVLTPGEVAMLRRFAEIPFLPVARRRDAETPVYLEERERTIEEYSEILSWLSLKGLISLDYDLPLSNFGYEAYAAYPVQGSMALTVAGQRAVELLEVQGTEA